jgi:hypothetical protein
MLKLKFGLTMSLMLVIPTGYLTKMLLGGMYGSLFKQYPPSFYISISLIISLLVPYILASIFIAKTDLYTRLPKHHPGLNLMMAGGLALILPSVLRIFTSMIPGGGVSLLFMVYAAPLIPGAKLLLFIGSIRVLMSVKPHESYEYK